MAKFLIVDDSMVARAIMKDMVLAIGHEICGEAENGIECIRKYGELMPDFVTMDLNMPLLDGMAASREIFKEYKNAKIFVVTKEGSRNAIHIAAEEGVVEYLVKPVVKEEFAQKVSRNL
jgi:two-component system, chemotaxis family, chemotaxis protein CheY